jgi:imidazolonepropionase-like amidohydrolase
LDIDAGFRTVRSVRRRRSLRVRALLWAVAVLLAAGLVTLAIGFLFAGSAATVPEGTHISGVDVGGLSAADAIALATGNNARILRRPEGVLAPGAPADIVLIQAPLGGVFDSPLDSLEHGDIPGVAAVVIDGEVRALRSRNSPAPKRQATMASSIPA